MKDITMYSDNELSYIFLNDEGLYNMAVAADSFAELEETARELFIFTDEQLAVLRSDWNDGYW